MKKWLATAVAVLSLLPVLFPACTNTPGGASNPSEGEQLARTHCASCHAFPDPSLLDKQTWENGVLPQMAELMNVEGKTAGTTPAGQGDVTAAGNARNANGAIPMENPGSAGPSTIGGDQAPAVFPRGDWEKIIAYYRSSAPESLPLRQDSLAPIQVGLPLFSAFSFYGRFPNPVTTMVKIDPEHRTISFADGNAGKLFVSNARFAIVDSFFTSPGITDIRPGKQTQAVSIGMIMPSDQPRGKLEILKRKGEPEAIIDNLRRPVQAQYADLNADGREDVIIAEFGFRKGGLSWFENNGDSGYTRHVLRALPGASKVEVHDLNKDGRPDIAALMAQGDEGVFLYYNEGSGQFREEKVIGFPSVYGSNHMQLFDFNGDGHMDILTTHGDNADYSNIFKPYHGIRIFYNDGQNHFSLKTFLPVYGAQKAMPADFDNDGDIDLASIAFNPHYEYRPEESFIYWENTGNNTYKRYTFDAYANGRWLTMDAGDMDGDGDQDIILGSAMIPVGRIPQPLIQNWQRMQVSITVLENLAAH